MRPRGMLHGTVILATLAVLGSILAPASSAATTGKAGRYLVVARSAADYTALRDRAVREGAKVIAEMPQLQALVIMAPASVRSRLAADRRALGVAADAVRKIGPPEREAPSLARSAAGGARRITVRAPAGDRAAAAIDPDPAFDYRGLLWNYRRIGLPDGWRVTTGKRAVTVAVADTGLDYTHTDLRSKVSRVEDLTESEGISLCEADTGISDRDLAAIYGGPVDGDWNGHGSWIGGTIAAALNRTGTNGIAPNVRLVALKVAQWCESAYETTLINAIFVAANLGVDVVNISFGGYTDRSNPDDELRYQRFVAAVRYARSRGTVVVAAAGNNHVRLGAGGRVLSHGSLTPSGSGLPDRFGQYWVPGGVPGVVTVSATNNVVNAPSATCPPGTIGDAMDLDAPTCKPSSDRHQPFGVGRRDQLAYYSNYGPRIDIAAPGGARKFNLPAYDRGGTLGFPFTRADLTNVWSEFSTGSNWAAVSGNPAGLQCFTFTEGSGFPPGQCYSVTDGTSMAAPHVTAAVALVASAHPSLRHRPARLLARVKASARTVHNRTPALSATDTSPADLTGVPCPAGYCHLGGPAIPDREAYGAGLVNVASP